MAYNYYPYAAQNYMPQNQQNQNNSLIWVQGENGAKAYLVAPGQTVLLMDSEGDKFYLKSSDMSGMPVLRTFEYKEITQRTAGQTERATAGQEHQFVTRDEFDALKRAVEGLAKTEVRTDE